VTDSSWSACEATEGDDGVSRDFTKWQQSFRPVVSLLMQRFRWSTHRLIEVGAWNVLDWCHEGNDAIKSSVHDGDSAAVLNLFLGTSKLKVVPYHQLCQQQLMTFGTPASHLKWHPEILSLASNRILTGIQKATILSDSEKLFAREMCAAHCMDAVVVSTWKSTECNWTEMARAQLQ